MVETAVELQSFIDVSPIPTQDVKLPFINCAGKIIQLHVNNSISVSENERVVWMKKDEIFSKFLDQNFTQIQKIEILKKIFHGIHTQERFEAIRYLQILRKK